MNAWKKYRVWIALAALVLPALARGLWFYRGFAPRPEVWPPDYAANAIPQPPPPGAAEDESVIHAGKVVVFDGAHANIYDPSELEAFVRSLNERGGRVEFDRGSPPLAARLRYADAYVVISPSLEFSAEEAAAIQVFVERGGRLAVFTDPTRGLTGYDWWTGMPVNQPDTNIANTLLAPSGISVASDYLYNLVRNEGNFRNVLFETFSDHTLTAGLEQVALYGTHSLHAGGGTALIVGDANTLSSATDSGSGLAAAALSADGNVLAVGDFSFLIPPYDTVADNSRLAGRVADFLLSGECRRSIADFPYIFGDTVHVVASSEIQMGVELLSPLGGLQASLRATDTALVFGVAPAHDADRIVIGLLAESGSIAPYLDTLGISPGQDATVFLPDFGTVHTTGAGFLFYVPGDDHNALIALSDSPDDLPALIELLAGGDLSACAISGDTAVCSLSEGGGVEAASEEATEEVEETASP